MKKIRIVIIDDHQIVRKGLMKHLNEEPDMEVIGEGQSGKQAVDMTKTLQPDIVLLDIAMPNMSGIDVIQLIRSSCPDTGIIMFSMYSKENFVKESLSAGAMGYVLKAAPTSDIIEAIRSVQRREYFLSSRLKQAVIGTYASRGKNLDVADRYDRLSEREQQVFRFVATGQSSKEIADFLCISHKTVEKHRASIMKKLDIHDRIGLMKYAVKIGVLSPELWEE